jgi:hypothetical protein
MKIFELLNSLTIEEKKYLKKYFNPHNDSLQKLFIELVQLDEEKFKKNKQSIFRKIYNKPWTEANEKYFWNQKTQLYEFMRAFISQYWIDENRELIELNKYIHYLNTLRDRLQIDLFEKEWNYYFGIFESKQYYYGLGELFLLQYNHLSRNPKTITQSIDKLKQAYQYKLMASWEENDSIQYTAFTTNYSKEIYGLENSFTYEDFKSMADQLESEFFNPLKSANFLLTETDGDKKWRYVSEIFEILRNENLKIKAPIKFKICQAIFNYALILTYNDELNKPRQIFEFLLSDNLLKSTVTNPTVFYFNYSTLLLKMGETEKALAMHSEVMLNLEGIHESRQTLFIIRNIYLNILNKELNNIYSDISMITPRLFKEDQQMYVRLLLIMYHVESRDIENACREAENARKSIGMKAEIAEEEAILIDFTYAVLLCINKKKLNPEKLKKQEDTMKKSKFWISSNHLLKNWLAHFIQRIHKGEFSY